MKPFSRRNLLRLAGAVPLVGVGCGGSQRSPAGDTDPAGGSAPGASNTPSPSIAPPGSGVPGSTGSDVGSGGSGAGTTLLATNSTGDTVSFIDLRGGEAAVETVEAGAAPHGLALDSRGRAYAATAEGVAVIDTVQRRRIALVPYRTEVGDPAFGEYRPGGWGIVASGDGARVYVAVSLNGRPSPLEVLDTSRLEFVAQATVGVRPFQLLLERESGTVYSIDHDSFSLTMVEPGTLETRTVPLDPLGRGAYDKPHYADFDGQGRLLMAYAGRLFVALDPRTGAATRLTLSADTHQHGVALRPGTSELLILGTGPAGSAAGAPSLTRLDIVTGAERVVPLARPHERIAFNSAGTTAYLSGGYPLSGGWDGLTIFDLASESTAEVAVPDRPMDLVRL